MRAWISLVLTLGACSDARRPQGPGTGQDIRTEDSGTTRTAWAWAPSGTVPGQITRAMAATGQNLLASSDSGLYRSVDEGTSWTPLESSTLPEGEVVFLAGAGDDILFAFVHGSGFLRSVDAGSTWTPVRRPPVQPLIRALNPRGRVVPMALDRAEDGTLWLAGIGGIFRSKDAGDTWALVDLMTSSEHLNVLFTGVSVRGAEIVAVAQLADSMLPASLQGLFSGTVFRSTDAGETWEIIGDGLGSHAPMAVQHGQAEMCVATMDQGVQCTDDDGRTWSGIPGGPTDVVALSSLPDGAWSVGSSTRGLWTWNGSNWSQAGEGAVAAIVDDHAVSSDGQSWSVLEAVGDSPAPHSGGTVHLALSFHVNLYHSYRGDSDGDDGYGQDIRVIRTTLDWLDAHPGARADWDVDNHFSLDGWLATDAPDIVQRIQSRVRDGTDDVRIMSWNNGALAAQTREEFDASVAWAQDSYDATFDARVPGVQPQECMTTPEHLSWYAEHGIEWITLFYAANGFTALREEVSLAGASLHNPVTLRDPMSGGELTWVPAWHHGDVLDHGGLAAWARKISASTPGDTLLLIHFDADAESWEGFGAELDALAPLLEDGTVVHSTIQDYLDDHSPVEAVYLVGDVADGTGDGFQSWAEKDFNHRLFTTIATARDRAAHAGWIGRGDAAVDAALEAALRSRLLALSTTHFGLASPSLHEDRVQSATLHAETALAAADAALALALESHPVPPGEVHLVNPRDSAGPVLADVTIEIPIADWTQPSDLVIRDAEGEALPFLLEARSTWSDHVRQKVRLVADVRPADVTVLHWSMEPGAIPRTGGLTTADAPTLDRLRPPFTACLGTQEEASLSPSPPPTVDAAGMSAASTAFWSLPFCGADGDVAIRQARWSGLPGTIVEVDAIMGSPGDASAAESVALTPLACDGHASTLSWRTHGGRSRTRPVRTGVSSWNGQAADGQITLHCDDGQDLQVAHQVLQRSSMAFAPIRDRAGVTLVAPLGTLWGDGPWHDGRRTGGSGLGEVVTALVGNQYRPAAPDWAGQPIRYQLLVGAGIEEGTLDLFAHPPLVRVAPVNGS